MQEYSFFQHYIQETRKQGIEQGERRGIIESIIALLGTQFNTDAVEALKPTLEAIDDLQTLKQLLVPQSESLETFMQAPHR